MLAREPIELSTRILGLREPEQQVIGGVTHHLAIAPDGTITPHCDVCGSRGSAER
jgi:hypothetical protein